MVLSRTRLYADGEILSKANNSINTQIIKALLCYYAVSTDFPVVESISIVRKKAGQPDYTYTECDNILQPIGNFTIRTHSCSPNVLDTLLKETPKGQTLRIAMSYWLKGVASDDVYYKFDHLWRAFNRLFMYQGNDPKENEDIKTLGLDKLYGMHQDYVIEIVDKVNAYNSAVNQGLVDLFQGVYQNRGEVFDFVWGRHLELAELENRPLSRFTKDLLEQMKVRR